MYSVGDMYVNVEVNGQVLWLACSCSAKICAHTSGLQKSDDLGTVNCQDGSSWTTFSHYAMFTYDTPVVTGVTPSATPTTGELKAVGIVLYFDHLVLCWVTFT